VQGLVFVLMIWKTATLIKKKFVLNTEEKFCYFSLRLMFELGLLFADKYLNIYPRYSPLFSLDFNKKTESVDRLGQSLRYTVLRNSV